MQNKRSLLHYSYTIPVGCSYMLSVWQHRLVTCIWFCEIY